MHLIYLLGEEEEGEDNLFFIPSWENVHNYISKNAEKYCTVYEDEVLYFNL